MLNTNKVIENYFYNLLYQLLILVVPLVTTPYVSRVLGAKGVGTFSYTNSIVQYFILFGCVGLNLYGQREIAYAQKDIEKRSIIFWELVFLRCITVSVSAAIFYFSLVLKSEYAGVFFIMILDFIASMIDISWFFQGIEDFKKIVIRNFIIKITGVFLVFIFVKSNDDLMRYVLCHSLTLFLGNLSMWMYVPKLVRKVPLSKLSISKHFKLTLLLFIPQIASSVYTVLDKTMIGYLTGIEEVAFYEQSQKIVKIVMAIVTSLGSVMLPRIANLYKQNNQNEIVSSLKKSIQFVCVVAFPMTLGLIAISRNMVPWFFGPGYEKVVPNMMMIAPIIISIGFSNIIGSQYLVPLGKQREFTISIIAGTSTNFILNLLLIPVFNSIGAAIATFVAESVVTVTQILLIMKEIKFLSMIQRNSKYLLFSMIMFVPTFFCSNILKPCILSTLLCVILGFFIYLFTLLITKDIILKHSIQIIEMLIRKE